MSRIRPALPSNDGEIVTSPPAAEWPRLVEANRAAAHEWAFDVAGVPVATLRALTREEVRLGAVEFSARLGVPVVAVVAHDESVVMTGHQPEFFHPGVWVKDFLLQRLADASGALGIDLVVDSDAFDALVAATPCVDTEIRRCEVVLAQGDTVGCFADVPVPTRTELQVFTDSVAAALKTLPEQSAEANFASFRAVLAGAAGDAANLAEFVTFARRRFEAGAGTTYLELPVTRLATSKAFATFVVDLALGAERFAADYNTELAAYRTASGTRSAAQPFPDLGIEEGRVELPLWVRHAGRRHPLWVERCDDDARRLVSDVGTAVELPADEAAAVEALAASGVTLAPKAVALTLFARMFACDLFIHGLGGARYDTITDGVIRRYFGVEAPAFVTASMTLQLSLGVPAVTDEQVALASERVNRFEHNPDALVADALRDDGLIEGAGRLSGQQTRSAAVLVARKARLVAAMAEPGAEKKALGTEIRAVNAELRELAAPLGEALASDLSRLKRARAGAEIVTDRTYPFFLFSPGDVAGKVE